MIEKPLEKFETENNVLAVGKGFAEGTTSLVRHTVSGAFGSVNKITKSMADGFSALTLDSTYQKERMRIKFE